MKTLLVEDNANLAQISRRLLEEFHGHQVRVAATGARALALAKAEVPDVVLIDIRLPDMSGYQLARKLRSDPAFQRTFLVGLTALGADEGNVVELGLDAFYRKPMDFSLLEHLKRE